MPLQVAECEAIYMRTIDRWEVEADLNIQVNTEIDVDVQQKLEFPRSTGSKWSHCKERE